MPQASALIALGRVTLGPAMRALLPANVSPTEPLGKFLTEMAMGRYEGRLTGAGVQTVKGSRIVNNAGFRRLAGL